MTDDIYEVIVVGGGPAGLTASIRCRTHGLSVLILEAKKFGGQLSQLYPHKYIENYASHPEIRAGYLADLMVTHAKHWEVPMKQDCPVENINFENETFKVITRDGAVFEGRTVILAIGMGLYEPRKLGLPNEEKYRKKGVIYSVPNLNLFRGQKIIVVGGGDTALENAIMLSQVAEVTLVHRSSQFRAIETNIELLEMSLVKVLFNTEVKDLHGQDHVRNVELFNNQTGEGLELDVDNIVINVGFSPELSLIDRIGVDNNGSYIMVESNMHTNIQGMYACGDIVDYPGKSRQIQPATGEAFIAAEEAYIYLKGKVE